MVPALTTPLILPWQQGREALEDEMLRKRQLISLLDHCPGSHDQTM